MPLEVALPDSSLSDCSDLRQKTIKTGQIARALAVFKIDKVTLYETKSGENNLRDLNLFEKLLRYMDTPQYLRRDVFPMTPSLKYAGLLPPLRIQSHPLGTTLDEVEDGEFRWGIQKQSGYVDIGLEDSIEYDKDIRTRVPTIFQVHKSRNQVRLEPTTRESIDHYFGLDIQRISNLTDYLEKNSLKTRIVFSRMGTTFSKIQNEIESVVRTTRNIITAFGGPHSGVRDLVQEKDALKQNVDFWVNMIPNQGTETVRLEEALWISLGQFNTLFGDLITKRGYYK